MKIFSCFLLFVLLLASAPVFAESKNCVPDVGCAEGQEPLKDCCQLPDCEFWNALEEARATRRIISVARLSFPGLEDASAKQDYEQFNKRVRNEVRKIRKTFPKCKVKGKRKNPPIFSLDPENQDCRIMTHYEMNGDKLFRELGVTDAQRVLDGCAEIVEAKYESTYVGSTYCAMEANSPFERMQERQERATREMTVLEDHLIRYWRACTISPDYEPTEVIVNNSVDVLKRFNYYRKWKAPPAGRAGK